MQSDAATRRSGIAPAQQLTPQTRKWLGARYGEMARTAGEADAGFAVVMIPYSMETTRTSAALLHQQLADLGRSEGWETFDLLSAFQAAGRDGGAKLFADLWHPTPRGHAVAARALAGRLSAAGMLMPTVPKDSDVAPH